MALRFFDTLRQEKVDFQPIEEGKIGIYVCGVTVYDMCHIGHARCYVAFDTIIRFLRYLDYEVHFVRNFTDVDDKIKFSALVESSQAFEKRRPMVDANLFRLKFTRRFASHSGSSVPFARIDGNDSISKKSRIEIHPLEGPPASDGGRKRKGEAAQKVFSSELHQIDYGYKQKEKGRGNGDKIG